jgi:hypothetical protein
MNRIRLYIPISKQMIEGIYLGLRQKNGIDLVDFEHHFKLEPFSK